MRGCRILWTILGVLTLCVVGEVFAADRDIYIASRDTDSIKRYDGDDGSYLGDFVSPGSGGLDQPQECLFGPGDDLFVTGFQNTQVLRYDGLTGEFIGPFTSGYSLSLPAKMQYGPDGHMYISQWAGSERVVRFDRETGVFIDEFTEFGVINNCGMAWDPDGNMYLAYWGSDGEDGGVWKFGPDGSDLGMVIDANVRGPVNLWFGPDDDLFVLDWTEGSVERFDGTTLAYEGRWITNLSRAEGFVFGPDGRLFICDWQLNRVARYEPDGTFLDIFASGGGMLRPNSITFGPDRTVSVDQATGPGVVRLGTPRPNPFRGSTHVEVVVDAAGLGSVEVFDVAGRRVATLLDGELAVGLHRLEWHAGAAAAGVYYLSLTLGGDVETRRITRLAPSIR